MMDVFVGILCAIAGTGHMIGVLRTDQYGARVVFFCMAVVYLLAAWRLLA